MAAVGHGGLKEGQVVNKLVEEYRQKNKKDLTDKEVMEAVEAKDKPIVVKSKSGIIVKGLHDLAVRFQVLFSGAGG